MPSCVTRAETAGTQGIISIRYANDREKKVFKKEFEKALGKGLAESGRLRAIR
jgi:hypothetical protein